jgi:hypothetical protein
MKTGVGVIIGDSLLCSFSGEDWHFFLRRLDRERHVPFSAFHKKPISPADVAKYFPNWHKLRWTKIKNSMLGKSESYAKDDEFEVNVYVAESSKKKHQDAVDAFLAFMSNKGEQL